MGLLNLPMGHFIPGKGKTLSKVTQTLQRSKTLICSFFKKKPIFAAFRPFLEEKFFGNFLGVARNENKLLS